MKIYSKRIQVLKNLFLKQTYSYEEAISLLKLIGNAKFTESLEAHITLNINPKFSNQHLRATLILPHGTGKQLRIAVLTEVEDISNILNCGASLVGLDNLLEHITTGNTDFDILITTPNLMPKLVKLGKILGPKGLMPSSKAGTVTNNLFQTLNDFKKGKIEYRTDKTGIVHITFGKINFSELAIKENLIAVYNSIEKNKPSGIKGNYLKSFTICTTMSPSIKLDLINLK